MDNNLLLSAFFALGIAMMFLGLDLVISGRKVPLQSRLDGFAKFPTEEPAHEADSTSTPGGSKRIGPASWDRQLATELARADLAITPSEFKLAIILFATLGLLLGLVLLRNPLLGLIGLVLGVVLPRFYVIYLQRKRLDAFAGELESALMLLSNTLRSGYGLTQAIESVSHETAPPLSVEFARVVREVSLGLTVQGALANLVRRNPILDLEMVVTAVKVNYESGGNLSEVIDQIAVTIRDRVRMTREIQAITSQQRLSATVLMLLPVAVSLAIYVMNPNYISLLWTNTCGLVMLLVGVAMLFMGFLVVRRILAFKY